MKSPFLFIAKPHGAGRYCNTKQIGGIDFLVSTSEEDHQFANRYAEVVATPIHYDGDIKAGDLLLVHHNVFKFYNDMYGQRQSGRSFFRDDKFFIEPDQFFMYKNESGWNAYDRYCFVEPVPPEDSTIYRPITEEPLVGVMRYPNQYLRDRGIESGSRVSFRPEQEYEFDVDGEKMYRMFDHQITMVL